MNARDRALKLERARQHQRFCRERNRKQAQKGVDVTSSGFGKPPQESRSLRRRLARAGRSQWRGRRWKRGSDPLS